jgi:hypothetical protein
LALRFRSQDEAEFRPVAERRHDGAAKIEETDIADKIAGRSFANGPHSIAEQRPDPGVTQQPRPDLLPREGDPADVPGHGWIRPHCMHVVEILGAMSPQTQPLGRDRFTWLHVAGFPAKLVT